jgi:hypothetical protein
LETHLSNSIFQAITETIKFVVDWAARMSLPLAIVVGAGILSYVVKGMVLGREGTDLSKTFGRVFAYIVAGLFIVCGWSGLKAVGSGAWDKLYYKQSEAVTEDPVVKAPPIEQAGPVVAAMVEKTYSRTLTLPPEFFQQVGAEGVGALSPYLVDPTAENVKSMVDSFRRSGEDVVFSRELTREDESPLPFDAADIDVKFERIESQAYRVHFKAEYRFTNETGSPTECRFLFYPPQSGGTIQALKVQVDGQTIEEPDGDGNYAWVAPLEPGVQKRATVSYESIGSVAWYYQVGSLRRRVRDFSLTATVDGPVEFEVGTINPTKRDGDVVEWRLNDVLTTQRLGLVFPEDIKARDAFLDGIGTLPVAMVLMLTALVAVGLRTGQAISPRRLALATATTVIGLGSCYVLHESLGYLPSLLFGSVFAAVATAAASRWRSLYVLLPIALIPVASMGHDNSDVWILVLSVVALGLLVSPIYARDKAV